ncbi:hypothetical protein FD754_022291 [Muntiacus muntjak]|uniref:SH2 domain-containing protein n=1 Tax=Muntiacus muntjak TaxID=9888 RepID=A0A5N3V8C9_MUNMU|nr:hypothetical protein FD754_022291 [Muntiacus muntjak]
MSRKKPFPVRSDDKDVQHGEWYIGKYKQGPLKENTTSRPEPYVLVVFYGNKICNVKIHLLERNQQFVPASGLRGDENFDSVEAIIEHYKCFAVKLIDGKDKTGIHG